MYRRISFVVVGHAFVWASAFSGNSGDGQGNMLLDANDVLLLQQSLQFQEVQAHGQSSFQNATVTKALGAEFPDAFNQAAQQYADWECEDLCKSRAELHAGDNGCCQWESLSDGSTRCDFFPYQQIASGYAGSNFRAWSCTRGDRGGGACAKSFGKKCKGSADANPIQVPPTSAVVTDSKQYTAVWVDEFDSCGDLNESPHWSFEEEQRSERLQWYTNTQAQCVNGELVITAEHKTPMEVGTPEYIWRKTSKAGNFEYVSSSLTSKGKRTFTMGGCGKVEFKAKIDIRSGAFPAWWAMGDFLTPEGVQCKWPGCGEIDMMEYAGKHGWLKTNFCIGKGGDNSGSAGSGGACDWQNRITGVDEAWSDEYHTWTMRWDEELDLIEVYVDGAFYLKQTFSAADPDQTGRSYNPWRGYPHYMIINIAIGFVGGDPTPTQFPMLMNVDYVGYWTCSE